MPPRSHRRRRERRPRSCCGSQDRASRPAAHRLCRARACRGDRGILLAIGLSYAVARTITRPLGAITATMREVAATGDLTRKIRAFGPSAWQDRTRGCWRRRSTRSPIRSRGSSARPRRRSACCRSAALDGHRARGPRPLMIIKAALRSLRPEAPAASDIREAVKDIDEEVDRLNRTVNDVLDSQGPGVSSGRTSDLVRLCQDVVSGRRRRGSAIDVTLPVTPLLADTDPDAFVRPSITCCRTRGRPSRSRCVCLPPLNRRAPVHLTLDQPDGGTAATRDRSGRRPSNPSICRRCSSRTSPRRVARAPVWTAHRAQHRRRPRRHHWRRYRAGPGRPSRSCCRYDHDRFDSLVDDEEKILKTWAGALRTEGQIACSSALTVVRRGRCSARAASTCSSSTT